LVVPAQVAGEWEIKPRWRHDYKKMIREQMVELGRIWPS
jgi:hypothetical protein